MSLVNARKWARMVGKASFPPGPMPPLQAMIDASLIARFNPQGAIAPGDNQIVQSFYGMIVFDPPVAGFNQFDVIAQFPGEVSSGTTVVIAPIVPNLSRNFAPGVYEIGFSFNAATANVGMSLFLRDQLGNPLAGFAPPSIGFLQRSAGTSPFFQCTKIYADKPWHADLVCLTAWADAAVGTVVVQVVPIHLFDDYSG